METQAQPTKWSENLLFVFLGALSAVIVSIGTLDTSDTRTPASQASSFLRTSEMSVPLYLSID